MLLKLIIVLTFFVDLPNHGKCSSQEEQVERWTQKIGQDLRMLGEAITRYSEIKQRYKHLNAKVAEKDPFLLLKEIKENVTRMIDRKMDAIECIQRKAEKLAENFEFNKTAPFQYYSSKWSQPGINATVKLRKSLKGNAKMYKPMVLNNDTHFYNLAVDTNHSSVHVPTNIYDKEEAAAFAIQWSEGLDDVFVRNYKSDPALSWQYFGSTSGIMRHYPAKPWEERKKDLFDCRIRPWFIEAATCTKYVVILLDNSGSMDGMGHHIGSLTASSLLNTFSNNDFINVLNYSATTDYTIPCFVGNLVQATRENVNIFKEAIDKLKPEGKTDLGQALEVAFGLLRDYGSTRGCVENSTDCNQAIMIITDGVNANVSDAITKSQTNGSIPVRIFTYLVGQEVTNVEEIKWISCTNRGYYTHVQSLEQVTSSVLQYISVVARPLVLQGEDHPISWTHAYVDLTYDDKNDDVVNEPYRLLTSVAIPCYDTKINKMNDTRTAYLLGVAGTDVPLEEFSKLTVPHKIGVNGYSFIVSNNGYVLMHPDLRPVFEGILKDNYNSIDLTQVEQHDDDLPVREIGDSLRKLRQALVDATNGTIDCIRNIKLRYHYDDMKRISEEYFDYYYTSLEKTPFSICIAVPSTVSSTIPNAYGNYTLEVGDEITKNKNRGENFTSFFNGKWKIHPRWIYCKYHYLEGHEFATPEKELTHFLNKMYGEDFKWERQYEEPVSQSTVDCGINVKDHDRYYCDKELMQKLIFDAEVTNELYNSEWKFNKGEIDLFERFNAKLRFVATMSGLTRWHYIPLFNKPVTTSDKNESKTKEFGDIHPRAINEKWYKSAVLQHQYDPEAFVYSVPFDAGLKGGDTVVTGSYAIFASDGGKEAPGSVVGFQFSQANLSKIVENIFSNTSNECVECLTCNGSLICYIIDNSGYIIVSNDNKYNTGRFFGQVEGDILNSMLEENIFKKLTVYDYQALCRKDEYGNSSSSTIYTPLAYVQTAIHWMFVKMVYFIAEMNMYSLLNIIPIYAQDIPQDLPDDQSDDQSDDSSDDDDTDESNFVPSRKDDYYACETEITLFVLQQNRITQKNFSGEIDRPGVRTYYVKKIPFSNLIFVAIHPTSATKDDKKFTTEPKRITEKPIFDYFHMNSTLLPCKKLNLIHLPRRKLEGCYNEHELEHEILDCGKACPLTKTNLALFLLALYATLCVI